MKALSAWSVMLILSVAAVVRRAEVNDEATFFGRSVTSGRTATATRRGHSTFTKTTGLARRPAHSARTGSRAVTSASAAAAARLAR